MPGRTHCLCESSTDASHVFLSQCTDVVFPIIYKFAFYSSYCHADVLSLARQVPVYGLLTSMHQLEKTAMSRTHGSIDLLHQDVMDSYNPHTPNTSPAHWQNAMPRRHPVGAMVPKTDSRTSTTDSKSGYQPGFPSVSPDVYVKNQTNEGCVWYCFPPFEITLCQLFCILSYFSFRMFSSFWHNSKSLANCVKIIDTKQWKISAPFDIIDNILHFQSGPVIFCLQVKSKELRSHSQKIRYR